MKSAGDCLKAYLLSYGRVYLVLVCWAKVEIKLSQGGLLLFPLGGLKR